MVEYRGVYLLTKDEYIEVEGKEPEFGLALLPDLYLSRIKLEQLVQLSGIEQDGAVDYAVPQQWFEEHADEIAEDWRKRSVWFYPHKGPDHIFGRPVSILMMMGIIRDRIQLEAFEMWERHYAC